MPAFLDACHRRPTDFTPIWLMRQAGRYQPSYRAIREKVSFLELCKTPELACQVTVDAVEQLGVDAAIIFADILLILEPLGVGFEFAKNHGPKIHEPIRTAAQVDAVAESVDPNATLGYVMEAIRLARAALDVPLIGFAGAPFTLASYAIEGGGSKNYYETKKIMYGDEGLWHALMGKLSRALADYLNAQIDAGAQAVQLFDSWIGCLSPEDYVRYVQPHVKTIFDAVGDRVPATHFGTGNTELYPHMKAAGGSMIGVDWRVPFDVARERMGDDVAHMGNLEPAMLLAPIDVMKARATRILEQAGPKPGHVFNLGHGIMPQTTVDQVKALVDHVHETSERMRSA
ncbi:MAG: uroporphyrinogen decarboxylase [Myxococcota bacterium]